MQKLLDPRIKDIVCTVGSHLKDKWSQVKHSSVDNTAPVWKDGRLHIAQSQSAKFMLVLEYRNAPLKIFTLNVKSKTHPSNNKGRAVLQLKDGSVVSINNASSTALEKMMEVIEAISRKGKPPSSGLFSGAQLDNTSPPWVKDAVSPSPKTKPTRERALTPGRIRAGDRDGFTSVKTPSSHHKTYSPWKSGKRKTPDDDVMCEDDADDAENLGASMLFSDQMDKENRYTPTRGERQSVLHKRMKSGGSLFLESFEEKQKGMSESKRKGPNPAVAVSHNFYSRGRQLSSFGASELFSRTPSTSSSQSEETVKKSTPGYLVSRSNNVPRQKFSFNTWNKPSGTESSLRSLQGFSNLGNTCYMNAILQSLLGLQCFIHDLQHMGLIKALPKSSLYWALSRLLYCKQNNKASTEIENRLQSVKAAISATATRFSGFMQHDAHEFLCQTLDQLREDVEKVNNPKTEKDHPSKEAQEAVSPPSQVVPSTQSEDKPKFPCAVSQNFELEVEHSILCQECGEEVSKKETFNDLSLDLPRTNEAFSLQTALDSFCASEKLEYACAKCDCKESMVNHKFTKLPRVLVLHLKRYTYDSEASADGKLRLSVGIPRFLTLSFHTTKNTVPPPARSNVASAPYVPLSPLRDNIGTPFNHSSPDQGVDGGSIRKKLDYESTRSGFKFNRDRISSDSARKGTGHFISRFETEVASENKSEEKSKDETLRELDEDQQLALALELSRQEAEARRQPKDEAFEEFTDEELAQVLNVSIEAEERAAKSKVVVEEESDDELPVGLNEDVELSDLEQALQLSKKTHQEELLRHTPVSGGGTLRPLTNVGLLGGARMQSTRRSSEQCNVVNKGLGTQRLRQGGRRRLDEAGAGLLGGAKRYQQQCRMSAGDEPMDTEDDQPLAFSLDTTDEEDTTAPRMWDNERESLHPTTHSKLKELSNIHSHHFPTENDGLSDKESLDEQEELGVRGHKEKNSALSSTPDGSRHLTNGTSHHSGSRSLTGSPSLSVGASETKANRKDKDAALWKPYNNSNQNQEIAPSQESLPREDEQEMHDRLVGDGVHQVEDGDKETLSYEEAKAKEEEDIRKATELSMQEAKGISEREAAEILRAQEMSLQDFHQGMIPDRPLDRGDDSKPVSPVYTKEQAELLTKHSETGQLSNAYRLVSIVSHIGSTSMTGHYISDVYDVEKKCWLSYDDSAVMKRDERTLREERKRTGYIFFYQAKEFL